MATGKATTTKRVFGRTTSVATEIAAAPAAVWSLLTNAEDFARWNSTIVSLSGDIVPGGKLQLVAKLAPKRTFKLKVKEFEPNKRLAWGDAMGTRVYTLEDSGSGTLFRMRESIGGPLFPLFARMIPPFDEAFEQFTADLKAEAEKGA